MKILIGSFLFSIFCSCQNDKKEEIDLILDVIIKNKSGKTYEFKDLYRGLYSNIYDDSFAIIQISEKMKKRGFEVINSGHGNFSKGPRIFNTELKKADCLCTVSKLAYYTEVDSMFSISEKINCMKINSKDSL